MYSTGFPIEWISTAVPGTEVGAVCEDEHTAPAFRVPQSLGLGSCLLQSTREDLKPSSLGPFITSPQHRIGSVIWASHAALSWASTGRAPADQSRGAGAQPRPEDTVWTLTRH